jgi:RNA polymerase sigma-70 factor (ECF subfamily)
MIASATTGATVMQTALLSDEPTVELVRKARVGDDAALNALLERCMPPLRNWARGRLPASARGSLDTVDLVQEAAMNAIARLDTFEPRRVGAMQAYLRRCVINRIRDEMRRVSRRPIPTELTDTIFSEEATPWELLMLKRRYSQYRAALKRLRPKDRDLVVARMEGQWTIEEIRKSFGFGTITAARMAVTRAERRLIRLLEGETAPPKPKTRH